MSDFEPKVDIKLSEKQYENKNVVRRYVYLATDVGLWKSEEFVCNKFLNKDNKILDIGCGAGRTTFGLYELGYKNIEGVDASKTLIKTAKKLAKEKNMPIKFYVDDALALDAKNESYDAVIFSYNGLMTIPGSRNRLLAVGEIARVLKKGGIFIFTTHDRENNEDTKEWWREEKHRWENGTQDSKLLEYGDRIVFEEGEELFVHMPTIKEVYSILDTCGFDCVYTKMRWDICATPDVEKKEFGECRFFVAKKRN